MARPALFILFFVISKALGDFCTSVNYPSDEYCEWGCCDTVYYPCCDEPVYTGAAFIVGITIGSVVLVVITIVVVVCVRRRTAVTTVQYTSGPAPQIFSTTSSTTNTMGYSNPGFYNGPPRYY